MKNAPHDLTKTPSIDDYFAEPDVHFVNREGQGGLLTFFVALLLFAAECFLIYWVITGSMALVTGLILHAIIVAILFIYARALVSRGAENRYAILAALSVATCGPFGAGGVMLTVLLHQWFGRRAHDFAHWFDTIFPSTLRTKAQRIYDNMMIGRDEAGASYSIIPFLDVLSFGSETQKRQALAKMTSNFHPSFSPAFRKALSDNSNTIRVQAATAITKIENLFTHRLVDLALLKTSHQKDPIVVLALAEHYDNYAYTGLLDSDREHANRQHALEGYQDYLKLKPHDLDVRMRVGRILMREKEYDKAYHWFRQCMEMGYSSETMNQWYGEALFATGRYEELRRFSQGYKPLTTDQFVPPPPAIVEAMALWQSGGRA